MIKGIFNGVKFFAVSFTILYLLNLAGIQILGDYLYSGEGSFMLFLYLVIFGAFIRL